MARHKHPFERFFITMRHFPLIRIEFSKNIWIKYRQPFIDLFGVRFLEAEYVSANGLVCYDFEITEDEAISISDAISKMLVNPSRELRDIEITIVTPN